MKGTFSYMTDKRPTEEVELKFLEVKVWSSFEDAMRRFRSIVQKEKIISDYKQYQKYEKPSEKRRRLKRESRERVFLNDLRLKQMKTGEWERRQKAKEAKKMSRLNRKQRYDY